MRQPGFGAALNWSEGSTVHASGHVTKNGHLRQPAHEVWCIGWSQMFWIGVFSVLTREMLDIMVKTASDFVATAKRGFVVV